MKERTFINIVDVSDLIRNVGRCECYADARNILDAFVIENIGKQYETEDGTTYRNSNNPNDIKRETLATLEKTLFKRELIDEASEETLNEAIKYHNLRGGGRIKSNFVDFREKIKAVKRYVEIWGKEPVPNVKKKEYRLRPIEGKEHYIDTMFLRLRELGYISKDENKEIWRYLCGTSDVVPSGTIKWQGSFFDFCVLYDFFLVSGRQSCIFRFEKGVQGFVVSLFGYKVEVFKSRFSRDYTRKKEQEKKEVWTRMKDQQMLFT